MLLSLTWTPLNYIVRELKIGFISILRRHINVAKCKWSRFNKYQLSDQRKCMKWPGVNRPWCVQCFSLSVRPTFSTLNHGWWQFIVQSGMKHWTHHIWSERLPVWWVDWQFWAGVLNLRMRVQNDTSDAFRKVCDRLCQHWIVAVCLGYNLSYNLVCSIVHIAQSALSRIQIEASRAFRKVCDRLFQRWIVTTIYRKVWYETLHTSALSISFRSHCIICHTFKKSYSA